MTILITGSAGFIASNFVDWLLANTNHKIIGIDNLSGGFMDNVTTNDRNTFYNLDVNDNGLATIFENHKPDLVYHFAAYASEGRSNYINAFIHQNNTVGTSKVINQCVNHKARLVFISSIAVYSGDPPFTEKMIPNPIDCYGVSKYTSEMNVKIAGSVNGLDYRIVRPYNVYGEKQNIWDAARNVCGIFMYQALNGEPMTIYGDGRQKRAFTYVGDIMAPLYAVSSDDNCPKTFNLGGSNYYSVNELASIIRGFSDSKTINLPERHEALNAYCNNSKSVTWLNFQDKTSLVDGVHKMWEWAKLQPKRKRMIPPPLEIHETNHVSIK
jgi:UDP-glucose 4-epimerase